MYQRLQQRIVTFYDGLHSGVTHWLPTRWLQMGGAGHRQTHSVGFHLHETSRKVHTEHISGCQGLSSGERAVTAEW